MYARLVKFTVSPNKQDVAQSIGDDIVPLIAAQPGFRSVAVFGDAADGEYGLFVVWDSADEANAAARVVGPRLEGHLAGSLQRPLDHHLFNVLTFEERAH
jgi:hypothetical protein